MSKRVSDRLPASLARLLDGSDLAAREGDTFLLLTTTAEGFPHVALLSAGEVYAPSEREVRIGLWPDSATTANLRREGKATLATFVDGTAYYVELAARDAGELRAGAMRMAGFSCSVREALADTVGYARITSGVRFELPNAPKVLARWREQLAALRQMP